MAAVLVVGSGAREHAITRALSRSPQKPKICCFGSAVNPGIKSLCAGYTAGKITDPEAVVAFAKENQVEMAVIGPEAPLDAGVADALWSAGVPCVGPKKDLAQIECSKAFALRLLKKYDVPGISKFESFTSEEGLLEFITSLGEGNYVVKADGLCGGKGVKVAGDHLASIQEAFEYAKECLGDGKVVIMEKLVGQEFSLLSFCDGDNLAHMPAVQDHKRAYVDDKGPNTGGMGSYTSPDHLLPFISDDDVKQAHAMNAACIQALKSECGEGYKGVLYGGFIVTPTGTKLIEYNARFGDPECLNLLSLLQSDFLEICKHICGGSLKQEHAVFSQKASCCKYLCPNGYPEKAVKGEAVDVSGLGAEALENTYMGAVDLREGVLVETGSRTIGLVAMADTLEEAEQKAEAMANSVKGPLFHREDIGTSQLISKRVAHMMQIRRASGGPAPLRVAVLGSTRGTDMQYILESIAKGHLNASIELVLSNKSDAYILERARMHGIKDHCLPSKGKAREAYDEEVHEVLTANKIQVVLLIGWMRILSAPLVNKWDKKILNVHPSLLPAFAGGMDADVHQSVLDASVTETGCTVHWVDEGVDTGEIMLQLKCPVEAGETSASLKKKVQHLEGMALVQCLNSLISSGSHQKLTYKDAGVDIDAGERLVDSIKPAAKATNRSGVMGGLGGFGCLFDLKASGYEDPILVSSTDGVGTKLLIAQACNNHKTIGQDLVGMVVNDIIVQGAEPLFFLDYFATGKLDVTAASEVVAGIAAACKQSGCALLGGETAEMPGMYSPGHYDLAGFAVGAVSRANLLPRMEALTAGDLVIGLSSTGVHSNGFSLVRRVVESAGLTYSSPAPFTPGQTLGDVLLTPTKLYIKSCLAAVRTNKVKALAHITGGGLSENIPRVLPEHLSCSLDAALWTPLPVFQWLSTTANLDAKELLRTFNCGIGMVLVVAAEDVTEVLGSLVGAGETDALVIGSLTSRSDGPFDCANVAAWGGWQF